MYWPKEGQKLEAGDLVVNYVKNPENEDALVIRPFKIKNSKVNYNFFDFFLKQFFLDFKR